MIIKYFVGTSALYSGERRAKSDRVFSALGAIDELSAHLGSVFHDFR